MTTIAFDGKELVADSRCYQVVLDENGQHSSQLLDKQDGAICKIVVPKTIMLKGEPVLAIGVAGDANVIAGLQYLDNRVEDMGKDVVTGEPVPWTYCKELTEEKFYSPFMLGLQTVTQLLAVTAKSFALIEMARVPGTNAGKWCFQLFNREEGKACWAMIGTGLIALQEALKVPEKLGRLTMQDVQQKSARKCVQLGIVCDKLSGGPMKVWSQESGIVTVELDAPIEVAKGFADEQPDGQLPLGDEYDEELDRRLEALVAERAARKAA